MARAQPRTKLPLDRFAAIMGLDPRYFNQVTTTVKAVTTCANPWKQYSWQETDQIGREDVAQAIQQAEEILEGEIGYRLLPSWEVDERIQAPKPGMPEMFNWYSLNTRGMWLGVQPRWAHFLSGGIEAKTLVEAATTITYTDEDGDGYFETATITVSATDTAAHVITDEEEVAVYFPGESGADEWEVRPLRTVTISGGNIVITMWRHQLVLPGLWEALAPEAVDGDVNANFLTTVDVYRHWNDPQQQVQLLWSPRPYFCECGLTTCASCTHATQWGCLAANDNRLGLVRFEPATWDSDDEEFDSAELAVCRSPDRLRLWYRAGLQDQRRAWPTLQMHQQWERAIAYFAVTLLDRQLCSCSNIEALVKKWNEDLALAMPGATYNISDKLLDNPLGTTRGAIFAWRTIRQEGQQVNRAVAY